MMDLPKRKQIRLKEFDYSQNGAYFVTICTKDRKMLFGDVGADSISAPTISEIVQEFKRYSTLEYIKLVKEKLLPPFDKQIWQRSFYDHVIRNEYDYRGIWEYIDTNPLKWKEDCFYTQKS